MCAARMAQACWLMAECFCQNVDHLQAPRQSACSVSVSPPCGICRLLHPRRAGEGTSQASRRGRDLCSGIAIAVSKSAAAREMEHSPPPSAIHLCLMVLQVRQVLVLAGSPRFSEHMRVPVHDAPTSCPIVPHLGSINSTKHGRIQGIGNPADPAEFPAPDLGPRHRVQVLGLQSH
ncbi:hypothetical protein GGI42DRAFT_277256 [Trichoderma sp. SZMC 28013]